MAFGFGFNKTKALAAAEKYVQQGKLQNAISEYEKVVKADPKDLTVLNTIGDLYARIGQTPQAVSCFKSVGDAYAQQGFTVKAIAMYKKLTKLDPSAEGVLRLAELYSQQGLQSDARAQYLQLAEQFLRGGELEQAVRIFQKILEMDPENTAMQTRLAEVYVRLGKKEEARKIFLRSAEAMQARGSLDNAEELLQRVLSLDPADSQALMLCGKMLLEAGDGPGAIQHLEKIPDLDSRPDGLRSLMRTYLLVGRAQDASAVANKLVGLHNDLSGVATCADSLMNSGSYEKAFQLYSQYADRIFSGESAQVQENLRASIRVVRDNPKALELLRGLLQKTKDNAPLVEVTEMLAHCYHENGDLAPARDLYKELADLEPHNPIHTQNYRHVMEHMGESAAAAAPQAAVPPPLEPALEPAQDADLGLMVDELEAVAPLIEQQYPEKLALALRAAITDAELFSSYNLPNKAFGPLLSVLGQAPRDVRLNQRLASLYAHAKRFAEAADCCRALQAVYSEAGYPEEGSRYGELAQKYRQRAGLAAFEESQTAAVAAPPVEAAARPSSQVESAVLAHYEAAAAAPAAPADRATVGQEEPDFAAGRVQEIDLSGEWEGVMEPAAPAEPVPAAPVPEPEPLPAIVEPATEAEPAVAVTADPIADLAAEIRFCLDHSMWEEAEAAIAQGEALAPGRAELASLRAELALHTPPAEESKVAPAPAVSLPASPPPAARAAAAAEGGALSDFVLELEESLGDNFMVNAAGAQGGPAAARAALNATALPPPPVAPAPSSPAVAIPAAEADSELTEIFNEFKEGLEESSTTEDPETHYNLGVAFKEMGLLDEAIGELQKVCQAVDRGQPFSQVMQAYTWLAQCFQEKEVPEAAVRWYEKALKIPAIDDDTRIALHYELASAYEAAQNRQAALNHFMEVYGSNIDYRDVAERIKALKS